MTEFDKFTESLNNPEIPPGTWLYIVATFKDTGRYYLFRLDESGEGFKEFPDQVACIQFIHRSGVVKGQFYPEEEIVPDDTFQIFEFPHEEEFVQQTLQALKEVKTFESLDLIKANLTRVAEDLSNKAEN